MARREWYRLHFEYADAELSLVQVARAARPARRSHLPPSVMKLSVIGAEGLPDSTATAQADTCCGGDAAHHGHMRYVFELLALPDDRVRLTYPGFERTYALSDALPSPEPVRRAPSAEEQDVEAVKAAAAAGSRWIVVALANGFTADGMQPFLDQVRRLETDLKARPPFNRFAARIAVVPVRTPSPGTALGAFSAFGHGEEELGPNWFRFFVDQDAVARFMRKHGFTHDRFQPLVVVNTARYGGSGGAAAVFSLAREATEIAIHEMGHSEFGLSDEYANEIPDAHLQPFGPNVQRIAPGGFGALKWRALATPGQALPTLSRPGSLTPNHPALESVVGAFEGGLYQDTGVWRPQLRCAMRASGEPFCRVCSDVIGRRLNSLTGLPWP
jgi:hypothetical protein